MTDQPTPQSPSAAIQPGPPASKRPLWPWLLASALAVVLLAGGIGTYLLLRGSALERNDPAGARACHQLRDWINGDVPDPKTGEPADKGTIAAALGDVAKDATTPAIRESVGENLYDILKSAGGPSGDLRLANLTKLQAACVAAGESMPRNTAP